MEKSRNGPQKSLSLFDSICIIIGIIIGVGIYETTPAVAASVEGGSGILAIWLLGGILAMAGSLSYAELATAYPYEGGDYAYQTRAYGRWAGYLFGWSQITIIRPGNIALMAFVFARYAASLYAPSDHARPIYAFVAVALLTSINVLGVKEGKWTQNLLTLIKCGGLLAIVAAALLAPPNTVPQPENASASMVPDFSLALILVLFTFGGWNEVAYVSAEIRDPHRNIVRALVVGIVSVTMIYMAVNGAFLYALGRSGIVSSEAIAVDAVVSVIPEVADKAIALLICTSALGTVNGLIFTGARISYALGAEHPSFRFLGNWSPRLGTPMRALWVQGGLSATIIILAGSFLDTILYTAPVVWLFFLGTGLSVFILRYKDPQTHRPYRIPGFPITPAVFCSSCAFMLYSSVSYALAVRRTGLLVISAVLLAGLLLYLFTEGRGRKGTSVR